MNSFAINDQKPCSLKAGHLCFHASGLSSCPAAHSSRPASTWSCWPAIWVSRTHTYCKSVVTKNTVKSAKAKCILIYVHVLNRFICHISIQFLRLTLFLHYWLCFCQIQTGIYAIKFGPLFTKNNTWKCFQSCLSVPIPCCIGQAEGSSGREPHHKGLFRKEAPSSPSGSKKNGQYTVWLRTNLYVQKQLSNFSFLQSTALCRYLLNNSLSCWRLPHTVFEVGKCFKPLDNIIVFVLMTT